MRQGCSPYGGQPLACQKSILLMGVSNTRNSAHKTAFAAQMHKKSGHVIRPCQGRPEK